MVLTGLLGGKALAQIERAGLVSPWPANRWLCGGGESGARTSLGALASSTFGVASTIFSITISSLSFAPSQMGPRLLDNFARDRGSQFTLHLFLTPSRSRWRRAVRGWVRAPLAGDRLERIDILLRESRSCIEDRR